MPGTLKFDGIPDFDLLPPGMLDERVKGDDPGRGAHGVRCSTPDPTRYHDPATQSLEMGGQSLLQAVGSRHGLRGTVIPRATPRGGSRGHDPYKLGKVTIDPGTPGVTAFDVDLSHVTHADSVRAYAVPDKTVDTPRSVDDIRTKAAFAFGALAEIDRRRAAGIEAAAPLTTQPPQSRPAAPPPAVAAAPIKAASFSTPVLAASPAIPGRWPLHAQASPVEHKPNPGIPEPTVSIRFRTDQIEVSEMCHTFIRLPGASPSTGALVIGRAVGYRGTQATFRPDQQFVVLAEGHPAMMLVESLNIRFEHAGEVLSLYAVLDEQPVQ